MDLRRIYLALGYGEAAWKKFQPSIVSSTVVRAVYVVPSFEVSITVPRNFSDSEPILRKNLTVWISA